MLRWHILVPSAKHFPSILSSFSVMKNNVHHWKLSNHAGRLVYGKLYITCWVCTSRSFNLLIVTPPHTQIQYGCPQHKYWVKTVHYPVYQPFSLFLLLLKSRTHMYTTSVCVQCLHAHVLYFHAQTIVSRAVKCGYGLKIQPTTDASISLYGVQNVTIASSYVTPFLAQHSDFRALQLCILHILPVDCI